MVHYVISSCVRPIWTNNGHSSSVLFVWQDDFLLIHYDKGPCRNKLGHSRASVIWHRTQVKNPSSAPPPLPLSLTTLNHDAACGHEGAPRFCLVLSYRLTHSYDVLASSWRHNRKETAWSACSDKCPVVSVPLFSTKPIVYAVHLKKKRKKKGFLIKDLLNRLPNEMMGSIGYGGLIMSWF